MAKKEYQKQPRGGRAMGCPRYCWKEEVAKAMKKLTVSKWNWHKAEINGVL